MSDKPKTQTQKVMEAWINFKPTVPLSFILAFFRARKNK
jgi:hypothetical protein